MDGGLSYHLGVRRLWVSAAVLLLAPLVVAQINGVPPSVTSFGPGRGLTPGVAASVTSLGPRGMIPNSTFFPNRPCCFNGFHNGFHHRRDNNFIPFVAVPVYYGGDYADYSVDDSMEDQYRGGPTIFDRRGPGTYARQYDLPLTREVTPEPTPAVAAAAPAPVPDQPNTLLVFRDGHTAEIKNYAIKGDLLYDLSDGRARKIALADLDLAATRKQNDDRGVDFELPSGSGGS
jgi:hypothetical protein